MKTYFGYIRVSTAKQGQHGSSLQEQRDAILNFAARHDLTVTEWFEDRETAAKEGRTQFVRMMTLLEKHKARGVILHKIDRGARNHWDWARIGDLIDNGIDVRFVQDNLDLTSRGGRLAADIQAVVAADYIRNLRDEVRKGFYGRLKQGLYPLHAPVGYLDQGKGRSKVFDPVKGPLVRAAFELYASTRYSYRTLAAELHRRGLTKKNGKPLSLSGIETILRNPFYTGIIRLKKTGETFQGLHEPLIDAHTFKRVQDIIDGKVNSKVRRFDFAYRRLLSCGACGGLLTGELQRGHVYYRCHNRTCEATGIREDVASADIANALSVIIFDEQDLSMIRSWFDELEKADRTQRESLAQSIHLRIQALNDREQRLTDAYIDQAIDISSYNARKEALLLDLAERRDELRRLGHGSDDAQRRVERFFEHLNAFTLGPTSENVAEYRSAVQILTSNRRLVGRNLCVTLPSPFFEMGNDLSVFSCGPHRDTVRTFTRRRARLVWEHLKRWKCGEPAKVLKWRSNPSWFKSQRTRLDAE